MSPYSQVSRRHVIKSLVGGSLVLPGIISDLLAKDAAPISENTTRIKTIYRQNPDGSRTKARELHDIVKESGNAPVTRDLIAFDFNRAPFLLSIVEVRVERSKRRVVLVVNGIHGPLQWADLQTGGTVVPPGAIPSDPVEFIVPMDGE